MKRTIARSELYRIKQDFDTIATTNPGMYLIQEAKITLFKEKNNVALQVMRARFNEIQSKYVKKSPTGEFLTVQVGDEKEWDFVDSYVDVESASTLEREEVRTKFMEEMDAFFKQNVTIEY